MSIITKETTIGEALQIFPGSAEIMLNYGLHCIGCHVNPYESIEGGAKGHGLDDKTVNKIINDINKALEAQETTKNVQEDIITLKVTSTAASKIKVLLKAENKPDYALKVRVVPGGCSGHSYDLAFVKSPSPKDQLIIQDGAKIIVDANSKQMLSGVELDFVDSLKESGFKFKNPNAKSTCGCGESFS
ncbi:iron-sulfur cluster assembly accessory protein [Candidatus Woesearchaeota archaeon]|nr:iron-sulfur cluster assembly accessory protein [Candidatus Woesearchaeota archaeon]